MPKRPSAPKRSPPPSPLARYSGRRERNERLPATGKGEGSSKKPSKTKAIPAKAATSPSALKVGPRTVPVSNLSKILYPVAGFTKGQVIDYYLQIAPIVLPHLKGRALTLKRYPNGVDQPFFYEKRCPPHAPDWIKTLAVYSKRNEGDINYCTIADAASLVWVANLASLELHTLLSKSPNFDRPTMMVFDLDPGPPATIRECVTVALRMRDLLAKLGLKCFAKTSGSKGIHMAVPLNTAVTFDQTKGFSNAVAMLMERQMPKEVTTVMRKDLRPGKVFIDWSQNDDHKTTACAYTLRAKDHPTVSTPLDWKELEGVQRSKKFDTLTFEAPDVLKRVQKRGDLFAPVLTLKQRLPHI